MDEELERWSWGPDCERVRAAAVITSSVRHGVIDGVSVDFRHPEIDPEEWGPRNWWHMAGASEASARLGFKSDEEHGIPKFKETFDTDEGDAIRVVSFERLSSGPSFKHEHDTTILEAKLECVKADGRREHLVHPLRLYGNLSTAHMMPSQAFDRIEARAAILAGLEDLYDEPSSHFHAKKAGIAMEAAYFARSARGFRREAASLFADTSTLIECAQDGWLDDLADQLLESAALAGYLLAKAESEGLEADKEKQLKNLERGPISAKDRDKRRARALDVWKAHPTWGINRVSQLIAQELGKDKSSIMASLWEVVPPTSESYAKAVEKRRQ